MKSPVPGQTSLKRFKCLTQVSYLSFPAYYYSVLCTIAHLSTSFTIAVNGKRNSKGDPPKRYSMRCQHRKPLGIHTCECVPAPHINGQFHFDLIVQDCMPHIYRMPEESKLSDSSLLWSTLNARSWAPSLTHRCPLGTLPALEGPHVGFVKLAHRLLCIPWGRWAVAVNTGGAKAKTC